MSDESTENYTSCEEYGHLFIKSDDTGEWSHCIDCGAEPGEEEQSA